MRVAGIDCGTNSIRLLIADVENEAGAWKLRDHTRLMRVVRLGEGVDRTGEFAQAALERTFAQVEEYAALCREAGVASLRFAATSAARDARNREAFLEGVRARIGVYPQVITGEQEAACSFEGAANVLHGRVDASRVLAVDLGGGSTELVLGDLAGEGGVRGAYSMNVGCVRMHERHLSALPLSEDAIAAARADVRAALDEAEKHVDLAQAEALIGLAGTVTTITAQYLGLDHYDPEAIHGTQMRVEDVREVCEWFIHSSREERAALGFMHPGRIDVIDAGALVWEEVVMRVAERHGEAHAGQSPLAVITSEHDILDGIALWAAREPQEVRWG